MTTPTTMMVAERPATLNPVTLDEWIRLAEYLAKSDLVPKEFQGKPANIIVAAQYGAEVGLKWMQALQSIAVISGKPTLYGDAGLALIQVHPAFVSIKESDDLTTQTATCEIVREGWEPVIRRFSHADAERIQVYDGGSMKALANRTMWKNFPVRMRQMRARWWAMRDCFADALKGIMGREEIENHEPPADVVAGPTLTPEEQFPELMPRAVVLENGLVVQPGEVTIINPPTEDVGPPPAPPEDPAEATVFELNGQRFATKGMTRGQMQESFTLAGELNKKVKGRAGGILHEEFGVPMRADLTKELAAQYLARLREELNAG